MIRIILAACAFVALAGCENYSADFGDAVNTNIAAQSVQPAPPAEAQPVPGNGALAALAQEHYTTDTVKKPTAITTSNVGAVGGGGGQ